MPDKTETRTNTGPIQFGDELPGVYFEHVDAMTAAASVEYVLKTYVRADINNHHRLALEGLRASLLSRAPNAPGPVAQLKPYATCLRNVEEKSNA